MHRRGILRQRTDRIELIDIDDVVSVQTIVDRIFDVGTVRVLSSDRSNPVLELKGMSDLRQMAEMIDGARLEERRQRSQKVVERLDEEL